MALSVTIADNADGTGGVATIAGSDAGGTNTLYTMQAGDTGWTSRGSRVGNGTLSLSVNAGYYFAYVYGTLVSAVPAYSPIIGLFVLTNGTKAVYNELCDEVVADIQTAIAASSIPGVTASTSVTKSWAIDDKGKNLPHIFVTPPRGGGETQLGGPNQRDDWQKPIQISFVARCHEDYTTNFDDYTLARERLIRLFANKRFSTVSELAQIIIQPLPIATFLVDKFKYLVTAFTLNCKTREPRTP